VHIGQANLVTDPEVGKGMVVVCRVLVR